MQFDCDFACSMYCAHSTVLDWSQVMFGAVVPHPTSPVCAPVLLFGFALPAR